MKHYKMNRTIVSHKMLYFFSRKNDVINIRYSIFWKDHLCNHQIDGILTCIKGSYLSYNNNNHFKMNLNWYYSEVVNKKVSIFYLITARVFIDHIFH